MAKVQSNLFSSERMNFRSFCSRDSLFDNPIYRTGTPAQNPNVFSDKKYGTAETIALILESADLIFGSAFPSNVIELLSTVLGLFFTESEEDDLFIARTNC
jgi:hypothetical protein